MGATPFEYRLDLEPESRLDVADLRQSVREVNEMVGHYRKTLFCSSHTTAGFFEQSLGSRLGRNQGVDGFLQLIQELFPQQADYKFGRLGQKAGNAASHLRYIGAGLRNCVTYHNHIDSPVYFVDLDGLADDGEPRKRNAAVLGYDEERVVHEETLPIPVSMHPIDSVNLRGDQVGLFDKLRELATTHGIEKGRIDLTLDADERDAGLTVNLYETLLMQNDLREVLRDPLRFLSEKGRNLLRDARRRDPVAIANKTIDYAKYDLVTVVNQLFDVTGFNESFIERFIARFVAVPADRLFRMKRSVSYLVSDLGGSSSEIVQGTDQSPILLQWRKSESQSRNVQIRLVQFA